MVKTMHSILNSIASTKSTTWYSSMKINQALGCGAIKEYETGTVEIKRVFVSPASRKKGIASAVLSELESWAKELKYNRCVLETHKGLPEAIAFYKKIGYQQIPNYGQYAEAANSVCFEKELVK